MSQAVLGRAFAMCLLTGLSTLVIQGCSRDVPAPPASIVLITIDTLRADHLSTYGYFRPTSPTLDEFAREAAVFERAITTMATTLPAHASLMTSTWTTTHGLKGNLAHLGGVLGRETGLRTLAEMLSDIGYQTAAFVSAAPLRDHTGLQRGFATYDQPAERERLADETVDRVLEWLASEPTTPYFLWVHLFDPHHPRKPPPPYNDAFKADEGLLEFLRERGVPKPTRHILGQNRAYDGEILFTDAQIGRLFESLKVRGEWQDLAVTVTADHGEGLGQHDWMAHGRIYNEQLLVPLLIKLPRGSGPRGVRVPTVASLVDVVPTLVAALGLPLPEADRAQLEGMDLLAGREDREGVLSEQTHRSIFKEPGRRLSLTNRDWKYFHRTEAPDELYDLRQDPHETENVLQDHPEVATRMRARILALLAEEEHGRQTRPEAELDEEVVRQLRALGYLGGPSGRDDPDSWRGYLIWGHEVHEFRPCGSDTSFWVVDETGELGQRFLDEKSGSEPYPEIYAELLGDMEPPPEDGFGADYQGVLRVLGISIVTVAGPGCAES